MRETVPVTWSDEKLILLYCPVEVRTHDLPHTAASNVMAMAMGLGNVPYAYGYAFTHSAISPSISNNVRQRLYPYGSLKSVFFLERAINSCPLGRLGHV